MNKPFEFIAGALSLDLVDTLGDRGGAGTERLVAPCDFVRWLRAAGLADMAKQTPTPGDLAATRALREAIYRCGLAAIDRSDMGATDIRLINRAAAAVPLRPKLHDGAVILHAHNLVEACLSTIAADAIAVLANGAGARLRICPGCRMVFFDTSRPGMRRWCSSTSGCGNRAKVRNHRLRQRKPAAKKATRKAI